MMLAGGSLTFPAASGAAPFCRSRLATSIWPYLAATCRGLNPFCWRQKETHPQERTMGHSSWKSAVHDTLVWPKAQAPSVTSDLNEFSSIWH